MAELLFREDPYLRQCEATVVAVHGDSVELDRTVFYPLGGGQAGDTGRLGDWRVLDTRKTPAGDGVLHILQPGAEIAVGTKVRAELDWQRRHRLMRLHTALHLLSAVLPYPVTGGAVNEDDSRLDFDIPEAGLDKDEITAKVNEMIKADAEVRSRWITDQELEANPGLVKTMSVKPPMGTGKVRLIEIVGFDLQPCGGTHVRRTGEIGAVRVTQIEKKGKQNRRVRISFA